MQSLGYLPISQSSLSVSRCAFLSGIRLLTLIAGILAAVGSPLVATADPELRAESPEAMKAGGYCPPAPNECSPSVCNVKCFSCEELLGAAEQCKPPPPPAKGQWVSTVGACNALCGAGGVQPIAHHCELSGARVDDSKCDASERPTKDEEGCIGAPCVCQPAAGTTHIDTKKDTWGKMGEYGEYFPRVCKDDDDDDDDDTCEEYENSGEASKAKCSQGFPANWCSAWAAQNCCGRGGTISHFTLIAKKWKGEEGWDCEPFCKCN